MRDGGKDMTITMRVGEAELRRIHAAARLTGATRSGFMLAAALARADAALLDRVHHAWPEAAQAAFRAALAAPPAAAPRARAALERGPWRS